ncbi:beta-galactosidase [Microbacterium sp. cf332]|uniref:beta-galactosidase n=1 Tax=Microbacterium sp. cf332 TaxID=1761804 RepID=UPI000885AEB8|nr:beta-galactosidase [Microbacterium sp. cf332]SDQ30324.1 Glycosyl hydrolases family 35 [Microbacterium sp. cf332]
MNAALRIEHTPWPHPERPASLPAPGERARGLSVTDRALYRHGEGWVPVSGEVHYSRLPRERWGERMRQLRAAGVSVASTYAFWNHHVAERGRPRFDEHLDLGAFVDEAAAAGLDVMLRIGPWAHGESRNGGFPDWVQDMAITHRSDDPAYLELVTEWFGQLASALDGRARPGGAVVGIQLENELYDRPDHLVTLQRLAREAGMSAPLWTATAWGGAQLPEREVLPVFGGYADGFWVDPGAPWDPTFRAHFFPSHDWDDPGVGADVRASQGFAAAGAAADLHGFPPATCELGSGMATAYHRRPVLAGRDVAALAHAKIGNGSAWQGYYMFVGGRNPGPGLQETIDTGYPNDMPELGYDFHAPIGQSGDLAESAPLLRAQHAFLTAFGERLARMRSSLPDVRATSLDDRGTLRWALRSDGEQGVVVISHHQPFEQVADVAGVRLHVVQAGIETTFPSHPVTIPAGTLARWPVGLTVGGTRIDWATASLVTVLDAAPRPTLVLIEDDGISVEISAGGRGAATIEPRHEPVGLDGVDVVVLPADDASRLWVRPGSHPELWLTDGELSWDADGALLRGASQARRYDPSTRTWTTVTVTAVSATPPTAPEGEPAAVELDRAAAAPLADHGFGGPRHRAPSDETFAERAARYRIRLPDALDPGADAVLDLDWAGDVGRVVVDGRIVDDRFWDGTRWSLSLRDAGVIPTSEVVVEVLALSPASTVTLASGAQARRAHAAATTVRASVRRRGPWQRLA